MARKGRHPRGREGQGERGRAHIHRGRRLEGQTTAVESKGRNAAAGSRARRLVPLTTRRGLPAGHAAWIHEDRRPRGVTHQGRPIGRPAWIHVERRRGEQRDGRKMGESQDENRPHLGGVLTCRTDAKAEWAGEQAT